MDQLSPRFSTKTSRILAEFAAVATVRESPRADIMSMSVIKDIYSFCYFNNFLFYLPASVYAH